MTIAFKCPWCNNLCAFAEIHCGKQARCTSCQQLFIIPQKDGAKAKKVKIKNEVDDAEVFSGFYDAVFKKSKSLFTSKANITGLVFVASLVLLKFITWNHNLHPTFYVEAIQDTVTLHIYIGRLIAIAAWGMILKFYMDIIYTTAFGGETMPDIEIGMLFDFLLNAARPLYRFAASMTITQIPTLIAWAIMHSTDQTSTKTLYTLAACCSFVFPMLLLMTAISQDLNTVFRIDLAIRAIAKTFPQYCLTAAITLIVLAGVFLSKQYNVSMTNHALYLIPLFFLANLATAALGLFAARTLGLLYRHYSGLMPW